MRKKLNKRNYALMERNSLIQLDASLRFFPMTHCGKSVEKDVARYGHDFFRISLRPFFEHMSPGSLFIPFFRFFRESVEHFGSAPGLDLPFFDQATADKFLQAGQHLVA